MSSQIIDWLHRISQDHNSGRKRGYCSMLIENTKKQFMHSMKKCSMLDNHSREWKNIAFYSNGGSPMFTLSSDGWLLLSELPFSSVKTSCQSVIIRLCGQWLTRVHEYCLLLIWRFPPCFSLPSDGWLFCSKLSFTSIKMSCQIVILVCHATHN